MHRFHPIARLMRFASLVLVLGWMGVGAAPAAPHQGPLMHSPLDRVRGPVERPGPVVPFGPSFWADRADIAAEVIRMQTGGEDGTRRACRRIQSLDPPTEDHLRAPWRYLEGRCAAFWGWTRKAMEAWAEVETLAPALAGFLAAERAEYLLEARREAAAVAWIPAVPPEDHRYAALNLELARIWLGDRRWGPLAALADRVRPHLHRTWFMARFAALEAKARYKLDGDEAAWLSRLAAIWQAWRRHRAGAEVEEALLEALDEEREAVPLTLDEWVIGIVEHVEMKRRGRASPVVKGVMAAWPEDAKGLDVLATAVKTRKKAAFPTRQRLEAALKEVKHPAVADPMRLYLAESLRRQGKSGAALRMYRRVMRKAKHPHWRAVAAWEAGRFLRRTHKTKGARAFFEEVVRIAEGPEPVPFAQKMQPRALWQLGWLAWRAGDLEEADARWQTLIHDHPAAEDTSKRTFYERALYWRARLARKQGRLEAARSGWRFITRRFPLSWYATLSSHWLGEAPAETPPVPQTPLNPEGLRRQLVGLGTALEGPIWLHRAGFLSQAREGMHQRYLLGQLEPRAVDFTSALHRAAGDHWRAHWLFKDSEPLHFAPQRDPWRRWQASFPRPFDDIVYAEAEARGVDPMLIFAVMRQESGFRDSVTSYAAAHGLMQVLYPTAKGVALKILGEKRAPTLEEVYSPEGNIRYGAAFLGHLMQRYRGHPALTAAAYNAGPGAVDRWLKRVGHLDADEFVEEIPYDQARGYTRKVMRSYAVYTALYGPEGRRRLPMPLFLPNRRDGQVARK